MSMVRATFLHTLSSIVLSVNGASTPGCVFEKFMDMRHLCTGVL